jgi:phage terminase small subunit
MGVRGRKSSAQRAIAVREQELLVIQRPPPPDCLSAEAQAQWKEVIDCLPADHFSRALYPVLEAYCRHAVATRKIDQLVQKSEEDPEATLADYNRLLAMHREEARAMASLAVRLGIACASRNTTAKPIGNVGSKPWEE